jgi:tetratricopeptide (TPR) repeat protein
VTLYALSRLAQAMSEAGDHEDARNVRERLAEAWARLGGPDSRDAIDALTDLAIASAVLGDLASAIKTQERALEAMDRVLGRDDLQTREARAVLLGLQALSLALERGPDSPEALDAQERLADALAETLDHDVARDAMARVASARERLLGPDSPEALDALHRLALFMIEAGDRKAATGALARVADAWTRIKGPDSPEALEAKARLAEIL